MLKLWLNFVNDIWKKYNYKLIVLIILMITNGLIDGAGLALLLPLLTLVGFSSGQTENLLHQNIRYIFNILEIPLELKYLILVIIFMFFLQNSVYMLQSWLIARLHHNYILNIRKTLFSSYIKSKWCFFINSDTGTLTNLIVSESFRLGTAFYTTGVIISSAIITIIFIILSLCLSWQITLLMIFAGLSVMIFTKTIVAKSYIVGHDIGDTQSELQSILIELLSGAKIIKSSGLEEHAIYKFNFVAEKLRNLFFLSGLFPHIIKAIYEFTAITLLCLIIFFGTTFYGINTVYVFGIVAIFVKLIPRLVALQQSIQSLGISLPALRIVTDSINHAKEAQEFIKTERQTINFNSINITIQNLSVSYGDIPILKNINITIPEGKAIAIVGSSGAGKSTLIDCILRLVERNEGEIFVNNQNLSSIPIQAWRSLVGYVSQDTFLFNDTIKNNILWGTSQITDEEIIEATKLAYAHDFIIKQPYDYSTVVGNRGIRLSGGQKQRISLARALVRKPRILIMDEATSSLDLESEDIIQKAIDDLRQKKTIIIITHRLSLTKNSDYIYVLENGNLVEEGTFDNLIAGKNRFRELWEIQNKNVSEKPIP